MKISNFQYIKTTGDSLNDWKFFATVDVETGFAWWKKKTTKEICRNYASHWFFLDTGDVAPGDGIKKMARSYSARNNIEL